MNSKPVFKMLRVEMEGVKYREMFAVQDGEIIGTATVKCEGRVVAEIVRVFVKEAHRNVHPSPFPDDSMTRFFNGLAHGVQIFSLRRAPVFLRVVHDPHGEGKWDALDQLEDEPTAAESIYVYQIHGTPGMCHVSMRGSRGQRTGGFYVSAEYRYVDPQPADDVLRDTAKWRAWTEEQRPKT